MSHFFVNGCNIEAQRYVMQIPPELNERLINEVFGGRDGFLSFQESLDEVVNKILEPELFMDPKRMCTSIKRIKKLDKTRNTECPIAYTKFKPNNEYMICNNCKYNFSLSIINHLNINPVCPMCRSDWTDKNIYTVPKN